MADETPKITRDDLEAGFRELSNEVQGQVDEAKPKLLPAAVGVDCCCSSSPTSSGSVGATKSTIVEIRRI